MKFLLSSKNLVVESKFSSSVSLNPPVTDTSFISTSLNRSIVKYVSTFSSSLKNPSCINPYFARFTKKGAKDDEVAPPIVIETELDNVSALLPDGNTVPPPLVFS